MKPYLAAVICLALMTGLALAGADEGDPFFKKKEGMPAPAVQERKPERQDAGNPEPKVQEQTKPGFPKAGVAQAGFMAQVSYALGYDIVRHLSSQVDLDLAYFLQGVADAREGSPQLNADQLQQMLMAYQRLARQKAREEAKAVLDKNLAQGNVFLEGNKLREGVKTLDSGLQYQVVKEGTGPLPTEDSTVECHYRGTLLDGQEFDSSYTRGRPAVFRVSEVIPGWSQALVLMPVGSKWMLYIPADLAYGEKGAGQMIQPGHTLVFEVELLGIIQ